MPTENALKCMIDETTKLCFVTTNGKELTAVPCSKEVLIKIDKQK